MNKLITTCLFVATVVIAMNTYYTQHRFSRLAERIHTLEEHYSSLKGDFNSLSAAYDDHMDENITSSYHQLSSLFDSTTDRDPYIDQQSEMSDQAPLVDVSNNHKADPVKPVIQKVTENGYLNKEIWNTVDQEIKEMDAKQNKIFWEQMFSMIENNQIELYMDQ